MGGAVDQALERLRALQPAVGQEPLQAVEEALSYVATQRERIVDYATWQASALPAGRGVVERAVEVVLNRRMNKQGMRWKRANADAVVAVRGEMLNQAWDESAAGRKLAA